MERMVDGIVAVLPGKFLKSFRNHTSHQIGGLFEGTWMVGLITEPLGFVQDARDVMVLFGGSIVFVVWTSPLQGRRLYVMTAWCRMEQAS